MNHKEIWKQVRSMKNPERAETSAWFFKTGKGQYGEGDYFLGLTVPQIRQLARQYKATPLAEVTRVLNSKFHEERLLALLMMVALFNKGTENDRKNVYREYFANLAMVNNWDLVDTSAPHIVGGYLYERSRERLYELAGSSDLWERRISIVSTQYFIRKGDLDDTFAISELLLSDGQDLIHKASGWMLREAGIKDIDRLRIFLARHSAVMPRTMLRYSLEKFEPEERAYWMAQRARSGK